MHLQVITLLYINLTFSIQIRSKVLVVWLYKWIKLAVASIVAQFVKPPSASIPAEIVPTSVNYHFTRQCNYKCGFCFHTAKTSFVLPIEEAKRGLKLLKEAGCNNLLKNPMNE